MKRMLTVLFVTALLVAGCASAPATVDTDLSTGLQAGVVEVAEAAAAGDYEAGLAQLDELQNALDAAIADGAVTASKAASIQAAIDAVRADLTDLATPEPEPDPEPTVEPEKPGKGNEPKPGKPEKPGKGNKDN